MGIEAHGPSEYEKEIQRFRDFINDKKKKFKEGAWSIPQIGAEYFEWWNAKREKKGKSRIEHDEVQDRTIGNRLSDEYHKNDKEEKYYTIDDVHIRGGYGNHKHDTSEY